MYCIFHDAIVSEAFIKLFIDLIPTDNWSLHIEKF